jgi:hypothetical protein
VELSRGECRGRAWRAVAIGMRHRNRSGPLSVITATGLRSLLGNYVSTRPTGGMPQDGKDEIEMVGVQAGHEAADIFERLAKCEGFDEGQNVAFS